MRIDRFPGHAFCATIAGTMHTPLGMIAMRKWLALALGAWMVAGLVGEAQAQFSKSTLSTQVTQDFPDNTSNLITPAILRGWLNNAINSWQQSPTINAQAGTSYTIGATDYGQVVQFNNSSSVSVTLPQTISGSNTFYPFNFYTQNKGAGLVTLFPQGSSLINGAASYVVASGATVFVVSDGTNYQAWNTSLTPSVLSSVASTQTSAPTITGNNCGQTIPLAGGTFYNISIGPASGFPAGCTIRFINADPMPTGANATGAKLITVSGINGCTSGEPSTYVWPQQSIEIISNSTQAAWQITKCPGLWEMPQGVFTLNADPAQPIGNDNWGVTDGLATGSRAFHSMNSALNIGMETMRENYQFQTSFVVKCAAGCTDATQMHIPGHGGTPVGAQGGVGTVIDCNGGSMTGGVQLFFGAVVGFQGCTFATQPLSATQNAVVVFGTGGAANTINGTSSFVQLSHGARLRCTCTVNVTGSFVELFQLSAGASIDSIAINQTGNVSYSDAAFRVQSGGFAIVSGWTTNGFTATGTKFHLTECGTMEGTANIQGSIAGDSSCTQAN